jgi:hypothetical protein
MRRVGPVTVLWLLAPLIGELMFGATPLSRAPYLIGLAGLYGGGAIMIRELVRRRGLGAEWLLILGIAYGVLEEGLVVQSLFNPLYPGLDFLARYGRAWGVSWVWSVFIVGYHAVFSITVPVLLTELAFVARRHQPWLSKRGWIVVASLFGLDCLWLAFGYIGVLRPGYRNPPPGVMIGAALLVLGLIALALRARPRSSGAPSARLPRSPRWLRTAALLGALAWFAVRMFLTDPSYPVVLPLLGDTVVAMAVAWQVRSWAAGASNWTLDHVYAVAVGPLPISWLFGFLVVAVSSKIPAVDLVGHFLVGVAVSLPCAGCAGTSAKLLCKPRSPTSK